MTASEHPAGLEVVGYAECISLLRSQEMGRLGVVVEGRPEIFPVNYAMDGAGIVFRTDPGTKLDAAVGSPVVFEVDRVDRSAGSAWSVVVHGHAGLITRFDSPALREAFDRLELCPWQRAGSSKAHLVRIWPSSVTGRRIPRPAPA